MKHRVFGRFGWRVAAFAMFATLGLAADRGWAELPPQAYRQRQAAAPEVLVIKVRSVVTKATDRPDHKLIANTVEAVVEHVARTTTGLKPGAVIKIVYTQRRYEKPLAGPSEVPTLKEGEVRPAYLSWQKETELYSPAAGGFSFTKVEG